MPRIRKAFYYFYVQIWGTKIQAHEREKTQKALSGTD